jgi:hypothetical protein
MVLSEVAKRLMMMSGSDASTSAAECDKVATSRMNEVVTTTVPAGHHWPGEPGQELADRSGGEVRGTGDSLQGDVEEKEIWVEALPRLATRFMPRIPSAFLRRI